jgi:hypothetical protein
MSSNITRRSRRRLDSVAAAAAVVSFCALLVSLFDGHETREHDKLSVMPRLSYAAATGTKWYGLSVSNKGVGPAVIKQFAVIVDGAVQERDDHFGGWLHGVAKLGINAEWVTFYSPDIGDALSPNETLELIHEDGQQDHQYLLRSALRRLRVVIVYSPVYGETQTAIYDSQGAVYQQRGSNELGVPEK